MVREAPLGEGRSGCPRVDRDLDPGVALVLRFPRWAGGQGEHNLAPIGLQEERGEV